MDEIKNGSGKRAWGDIEVMRPDDVPPPYASPWWDLYIEIRDQLKTPSGGVLRIPFVDASVGQSACNSLRKIFSERDPEVTISLRKVEKGADVYVSRQPDKE